MPWLDDGYHPSFKTTETNPSSGSIRAERHQRDRLRRMKGQAGRIVGLEGNVRMWETDNKAKKP